MSSEATLVKQHAVRLILIHSLKSIFVEEMVVRFVLKLIFRVAQHHRRWKLIPFPYHVISKEKFSAVQLD